MAAIHVAGVRCDPCGAMRKISLLGVSLYHATDRRTRMVRLAVFFLQALWNRVQRKRVKVGEERMIKNKVGEENEIEEKEYAQKDCERNKKEGN